MASSQACAVSVKGLKSISVKKKTPEAPDDGKIQRQSTSHSFSSSKSNFGSATYHTEETPTFTKTAIDEEDNEKTKAGNSHCLAENMSREGNRSHYSLSDTLRRPHGANDVRWEAIRMVKTRSGELRLNHFRIVSEIGSGDVGTVYLTELCGTGTHFAMKVMKKLTLAGRKKLQRAQTEREILMSLDHPFLPMLYTHFETEKISCLVMDFCPGGDLHSMKQRQRGKYFSEHAARFYAAEVLLALEYLHMMGIVYRDLKPENVLVREDGHIMLSDFDLSLRSPVSPALVAATTPSATPPPRPCLSPPLCLSPRFLSGRSPKKPDSGDLRRPEIPLPELVAEPTSARSMSFVGTHEYLAPEIIRGEGHGSAVDWWTFGVFLYELLYGRTPFRGDGNRATFSNVVGQTLRFPKLPSVSFAARDLIWGLLEKDPHHRLAFRRGAAEVKQHSFFRGVNWALIRCADPPVVPPPYVAQILSRGKTVNSHVPYARPCGVAAAVLRPPISLGPCSDFDFF